MVAWEALGVDGRVHLTEQRLDLGALGVGDRLRFLTGRHQRSDERALSRQVSFGLSDVVAHALERGRAMRDDLVAIDTESLKERCNAHVKLLVCRLRYLDALEQQGLKKR